MARKFNEATTYCNKIKNVNKKEYAVRYLNYLITQGMGLGIKGTEPRIVDLSQRAAQAIRMNLRELYLLSTRRR